MGYYIHEPAGAHVLTLDSSFKSLLRPFLEFVYPPTCFVCEALMERGESRVCPDCWSTIRRVGDTDSLYLEMQKRLVQSESISGLVSLYHFEKEGTLQSIIHQLKYDGMTALGLELGRKLGERLLVERVGLSIDAIVPVPLHSTKLRERGYNQTEYIARGIRDATEIPVCISLLKRHKYTNSQTKLTASERKENVGDAFALNKRVMQKIDHKSFLVVDDVITTGSTIEACAGVLVANGAKCVIAGSVALAEHAE